MKNHAKTSASPASALAFRVLEAVCGSSSSDSFASFDPGTSSLRTSQLSLIEGSTSSSVALPRAGTMRCGSLYALPTLERPIGESESSSLRGGWQTPTVAMTQGGAMTRSGTRGGELLLNGQAAAWATPRASDGEKGGPNARDGSGSPHLSNMAVNMNGPRRPTTPTRGRPTSSGTLAELPLFSASSTRDL